MPKLVDHQKRREEVVEALWRVIVKQGIQRASTRSVSAETGWSRGVVDYYFSDMDELLLTGLRRACEVDLSTREITAEQHGVTALRTFLLMSMPFSDEQRLRARIRLSYLGHAVGGGAIAAELAHWQQVRLDLYAGLIADLIDRGELAGDRDPDIEAARIVAFELSMDICQMLNPGQVTPQQLTDHVDQFLDWLLGERHSGG